MTTKTPQYQPKFLQLILIAQAFGVLCYTFLVVKDYGWGLFDIFLGNIFQLNWDGQFNLDFSCYLLLSGCWIAWRNQFSMASIFVGAIAAIVGIIVFAPYILFLVMTEKGDLKKVLVGKR